MSTEPQNLFNDTSLSSTPAKCPKKKSAPVFKPYQQHQQMLLPPNLEELVPENHLVRTVNKIFDQMELEALLATYEGGGASAFHPVMMVKVLVYAYLSKIYSSRKIAKALREDINFMWLSGMQTPTFHTMNLFRSGRLKKVIDNVFGSVVELLLEHGLIDLREYFVDGTKLQAQSNKHKVIWATNTKRYKEIVQRKIKERLQEIDRINEEENAYYGESDLPEVGEHSTITSEHIKEQVKKLNKIFEELKPPKQTHRALKELEKELIPKLEHYEEQERTLAGRNSYSKTDPDATVFRTKDDQLLPAYNILLGTQNQFIVNYSFHQQRASEADGLKAHLERCRALTGQYPSVVMGDSAYGSEENYHFLDEHGIGNYLKYNTYHPEQTKQFRTNPFRKENFAYNADTGSYHCPQGREVVFKESRFVTTDNGYRTTAFVYECHDCSACSLAEQCKHGKGNRTIQFSPKLEMYRTQARANLESERGIALRKQRGVDVEPVFGDIKFNQGYHRCRLRGQPKVNVEIGLLSIAHNTKKMARWVN